MENKETKNVEGIIDFEITLDCPHCEMLLNLFDEGPHSYPNEEGAITQLLTAWFNNKEGADKPNYEIECPHCEKFFIINSLSL